MKALIIILSLCYTSAVQAESYLFVGGGFPGIFEEGDNGELQGLAVDLLKEIAERTGDEIKLELYPWNRAVHMVEAGEADVLIGPYKTPERIENLIFNHYPFYRDQMVFVVKLDNSFSWDGTALSLQDIAIGITRGWSYGSDFDEYKSSLDIHQAGTVNANMQRLLLGRIDAFATHTRAFNEAETELGISNKVKIILPQISITEGYFGFTKQRDLSIFLEAFDKEFKVLIDNDTFSQLKKKFGFELD